VACEIWVSSDQRLIAWRPAGAPTVRLERAGRGLDLPEEKPVVMLDQDELRLKALVFRMHVHGVTDQVHEPRPLRLGQRAATVAAALAIGVSAVECGPSDSVEGDGAPPPPATAIERAPATPRGVPSPPSIDASTVVIQIDAGDDSAAGGAGGALPIEVRPDPPLIY
jgi:hypothetical protein